MKNNSMLKKEKVMDSEGKQDKFSICTMVLEEGTEQIEQKKKYTKVISESFPPLERGCRRLSRSGEEKLQEWDKFHDQIRIKVRYDREVELGIYHIH